jgi:hypothetical protein
VGCFPLPNGLIQIDYPYVTLMAGKIVANCIWIYDAKFAANSSDWSGETVVSQVKAVAVAIINSG